MLMETIEGKSLEELNEFTAEDMLALFGPKLTPESTESAVCYRGECCKLPFTRHWMLTMMRWKRPVFMAAPARGEET